MRALKRNNVPKEKPGFLKKPGFWDVVAIASNSPRSISNLAPAFFTRLGFKPQANSESCLKTTEENF